jgi:hypothetical protein
MGCESPLDRLTVLPGRNGLKRYHFLFQHFNSPNQIFNDLISFLQSLLKIFRVIRPARPALGVLPGTMDFSRQDEEQPTDAKRANHGKKTPCESAVRKKSQ